MLHSGQDSKERGEEVDDEEEREFEYWSEEEWGEEWEDWEVGEDDVEEDREPVSSMAAQDIKFTALNVLQS